LVTGSFVIWIGACLGEKIEQILAQDEGRGSLRVAISGLNSILGILDSLSRLADCDRAGQFNLAVQSNVNIDMTRIAELLTQHFDQEWELKARIKSFHKILCFHFKRF
jgi:hypothetical protein